MKGLILASLLGLGAMLPAEGFNGFGNATVRYLTGTASSVWSSATSLSFCATGVTYTAASGPYFVRLWTPSANTAAVQVRISKTAPLSTDSGMEIQPGDWANMGWYIPSGWQVYVKTSSASTMAAWITLLR